MNREGIVHTLSKAGNVHITLLHIFSSTCLTFKFLMLKHLHLSSLPKFCYRQSTFLFDCIIFISQVSFFSRLHIWNGPYSSVNKIRGCTVQTQTLPCVSSLVFSSLTYCVACIVSCSVLCEVRTPPVFRTVLHYNCGIPLVYCCTG